MHMHAKEYVCNLKIALQAMRFSASASRRAPLKGLEFLLVWSKAPVLAGIILEAYRGNLAMYPVDLSASPRLRRDVLGGVMIAMRDLFDFEEPEIERARELFAWTLATTTLVFDPYSIEEEALLRLDCMHRMHELDKTLFEKEKPRRAPQMVLIAFTYMRLNGRLPE